MAYQMNRLCLIFVMHVSHAPRKCGASERQPHWAQKSKVPLLALLFPFQSKLVQTSFQLCIDRCEDCHYLFDRDVIDYRI